jgi:hypothetical protein
LFDREHHQRIARVLQALDAPLLLAHHCLFGGGTAIALRYGEYRESVDVDFLVADREGYRALRERVTGPAGLRAIARYPDLLQPTRDLRADQYGLRTRVRVDHVEIKFEIVFEARMALEPPGEDDRVCGVATLTPLDLAASKLLANSDRWADDSVFSRDLIDLAMMKPPRALLNAAIHKAAGAYGESVERDLVRAIETLRERPHRLEECRRALQMEQVPQALLWQRIRALLPPRRGRAP